MKRICVFCGSSPGTRPEYAQAARQMGRAIAAQGLGLVYGGSSVGLMGLMADAALQHGAEVLGVIPKTLFDKEIAHKGLSDLTVVDSMHQRKAAMAKLSDGFVAMPGGLGTFEEFFEVLTWAQLGYHVKPCGVLDVCGYYSLLRDFLDRCVAERFIKQEHRDIVLVSTDANRLLTKFRTYSAPRAPKWIDSGEQL